MRSRFFVVMVVATVFMTGCNKKTATTSTVPSSINQNLLYSDQYSGTNLPLTRQDYDPYYYGGTTTSYDSTSYGYYDQYYGYGDLSPLLAFADQLHSQYPEIMSVVKLRFEDFLPSTVSNYSCWNFTINSDHPLYLEAYDNSRGNGYMYQPTDYQIAVNWGFQPGLDARKAALVFSIEASYTSACVYPQTYNPYWYGGYNPYRYGYNGYYQNQYYYYPPSPCSYARENATLTVVGTLSSSPSCATTSGPSTISVDLTPYLQNYSGYAPYYESTVGSGKINGRVINYNGVNWY